MNLLRGKATDEDIKEALQKLDRLTQDELRSVAAETLGAVSSEQIHSASNPTSTEYPPPDVQAAIDNIREDTSMFCRQQLGAFLSD
jgi:hypothetical protein